MLNVECWTFSIAASPRCEIFGPKSPLPIGHQGRKVSPGNPHGETHGVSGVGHVRDHPHQTEEKPDDRHRHSAAVEKQPGGRIKTAAQPDVADQTVNDARHPAEARPLPEVLTEI